MENLTIKQKFEVMKLHDIYINRNKSCYIHLCHHYTRESNTLEALRHCRANLNKKRPKGKTDNVSWWSSREKRVEIVKELKEKDLKQFGEFFRFLYRIKTFKFKKK